MGDFQYTTVPAKLASMLDKLRAVGVPSKAHNPWLKSIGFKSSNDGSLLPILKFIGFADSNGQPTTAWKEYRGKNHGVVLAAGIKKGYSELFETYPEAWKCSKEDLVHFFSTKSTAGQQVIDLTARTFQSLCAAADWTNSLPASREDALGHTEKHEEDVLTPPLKGRALRQAAPSVHIDIQVHISPEATPEQIDKVFESMAKHLYGATKVE